jgi:hypothetical protein
VNLATDEESIKGGAFLLQIACPFGAKWKLKIGTTPWRILRWMLNGISPSGLKGQFCKNED